MIKIGFCEREEFRRRTKNKKIYCFGCGKRFQSFIDKNYVDSVEAVVDNYRYKKDMSIEIANKLIPIISVEQLREKVDKNTVVVITCLAINEILSQIGAMKELDMVECYIESFIGEVEENYAEKNKTASIKRYQIWEYIPEDSTAAGKGHFDIRDIVGKIGYQIIGIHRYETKGQDAFLQRECVKEEWKHCYEIIDENAILLLQHPFWVEQQERNEILWSLKKEKRVKIISVVHDIEALRINFYNNYRQLEFDFMLQIADILVVHNEKMREYFKQIGVPKEKIIILDIFDYLLEDEDTKKILFSKTVSIAGNLDTIKSPYINRLGYLKDVEFHLYGPNFSIMDFNEKKNIVYKGAFSSREIPKLLNEGFGLVWDGDSVEGCTGNTGNYLKYNNPHKLSLYLASGIPVFIWKEAAEADFVINHKLGYTIGSLYEIEEILANVDEKVYRELQNNVEKIAYRLRNGQYTVEAILQAEKLL